ncbi:hypothetical protein Kfla_1248 [Kribbella flavida DSM 17836]|uniref:Arsenate reductase n=1 Tax=Kribbella flavida (strain DSM 17836 / JCM 10339 / NBRC 14399) TaxID=479435 RepID=D2Q437_KRIFD|nr:hypothetical protein [Kribbella flavida]ADB30351.1 hypothetical protein Kfla_1248 [Kribbella flavida DSM 17836]
MDLPLADDWVTTACTLPTAEQPLRVAEFDAVFASSLRQLSRPDRSTAELRLSPPAGTSYGELRAVVADLTERETRCCSFFSFALADEGEHLLVRITVPPTQVAVLDALATRAQPPHE